MRTVSTRCTTVVRKASLKLRLLSRARWLFTRVLSARLPCDATRWSYFRIWRARHFLALIIRKRHPVRRSSRRGSTLIWNASFKTVSAARLDSLDCQKYLVSYLWWRAGLRQENWQVTMAQKQRFQAAKVQKKTKNKAHKRNSHNLKRNSLDLKTQLPGAVKREISSKTPLIYAAQWQLLGNSKATP